MLFPGQGSQKAGMGRRLLDLPQVADTVAACEVATDLPLLDYICRTPDAVLRETNKAQPAIFALSVGIARVMLDEGVQPTLFAGHSLGHFTALAVSGAIKLSDAAKLVAARGELMAKNGLRCAGGMGVVQNIDEKIIADTLQQSGLSLWIANCNLKDQVVISGLKEDLEFARKLFSGLGGCWTALNVSGAFHSPLLDDEAVKFSALIDRVVIQQPFAPLLSNSTGELSQDTNAIRDDLKQHMTGAVNWIFVMDKLSEIGITIGIESGPGKILTGLMMRHNRDIQMMNTVTPTLISRAVNTIKRNVRENQYDPS